MATVNSSLRLPYPLALRADHLSHEKLRQTPLRRLVKQLSISLSRLSLFPPPPRAAPNRSCHTGCRPRSESGTYYAPVEGSLEEVKAYTRGLPVEDSPETFGLHPNADITFQKASDAYRGKANDSSHPFRPGKFRTEGAVRFCFVTSVYLPIFSLFLPFYTGLIGRRSVAYRLLFPLAPPTPALHAWPMPALLVRKSNDEPDTIIENHVVPAVQ